MESDSSEINLVIITKKDRFILFCKLYWRCLIVFLTPFIFLPLAFLKDIKAYKCLYVFVVCAIYWISDAIHPSIVAVVPVALSSAMGSLDHNFMGEAYLRNELLDCAGVMMINLAVEECKVHRRVALKLLLIFGCSHYRLSFLLFFSCMFLSMWISSILACGLMMPLVKAVLIELEKMGILEIYQTVGKARQKTYVHGEKYPRPTEFTVFYFLGIAYSSTIGSSGTLMGSQANQILKIYCETLFPMGPKIEFPRFMLLNLPGIIVMETLLYFWMNFYFLGMFRTQNNLSLEIGLTEEEAQYINTLLTSEYQELGKLTVNEGIVGSIVILTAVLQATMNSAYITSTNFIPFHNHFKVSSTCMLSVFALFVIPKDVEFIKFFKKRTESRIQPLPQTPSKTCLEWHTVRDNLHWSVLFIVEGSTILFESLRDSGMTEELETFLVYFGNWPSAAMALVLILFFKILTEFATNSSVVYCFLPNIAKLAIRCDMNPYYLMMAATLSSSLPFHMVTGTPTHAMVAAYVHIPSWKMMAAGFGPGVVSVAVLWFSVATWSTAVWPDITHYPRWTEVNVFTRESHGVS